MSEETRGQEEGGEFTEDLEQIFAVGPGPTLRTRNVSGETRVEVGADGAIRVQARKRVRGSSAEKAKRLLQNVEVRMEQQGDLVEVRPHLYEQDRGWLDLFRGGRVTVDLRITVPRECMIEAQTVSGDLRVERVRGRLEVQSVSGDVTIDGTQGPLWVKSVSGDVSCGDFAGSVEANTVSGDLSFDRCRIRQCDVVTVSGDLSLDGALDGRDEHRIRTISGDVELALAGRDYEIGFKTMSGEVDLEAEGHVTRDGRRDRTILLGHAPGAPRVQVKTVSGDLTIRATHSDVPDAAEPPASPRPHEVPQPARARRDDARAILDRVARGELDVESAEAALDAARSADEDGGTARTEPIFAPVGDPLPDRLRGRILRIQVISGGKPKVNIAIPLAIARMGKLKMGASGLVKGHLAKFGIDLDEVLRTVERSGPIVDLSDNEDRVLIVVE